MRKRISLRRWVMSAMVFFSTLTLFAQTPTTNLTTHEPTAALPVGTTFEWHTGITSASALVPTPSAVAPGLYYGFYNFGSGCFSEPTPIRVITNACPTATVNLNDAVNAAPADYTLSFHSNAAPTDANALTVTAITQAAVGTYFVAYKSTVGGASCYSEAYPIVVVNTSCNPAANPDVVSVANNGTPLSITVLANDKNSDGTAVTDFTKSSKPVITVQPSSGTATVNATDGSISYTPAAGFQGTVSLIYEICSVASPTACDTALVTIRVTPTIVANPDNESTIVAVTKNIAILSNDLSNRVAATLTNTNLATITQAPTKGTATVKPDGTIDYIANIGATGTDVFIYQICDKTTPSVCDTALVTITLGNFPVTVTPPATITGVVGTVITGNPPNATGGTSPYTYSDGSSDPACIQPVGYTSLTAAGGTVNGLNTSTGAHTVTAPNAVGDYYYCIKVCDASGTNCAVSIHKVIVTPLACNAGYASPKIVKN